MQSFYINSDKFFAFASSMPGENFESGSLIYKWGGRRFAHFQSITTYISFSLHPFVMCGETYLGVSHLSKNSEVYKFSGSYSLFIKYQEIFIQNVYSLTSFEHKSHTYLVFGKNSHSTLYKWI